MLRLYFAILLAFSTLHALAADASKSPLAAFFGHWEGSSKMLASKYSKPEEVTSKADCKWSPQQAYLVCEQTIHDSKGVHTQLTAFTPNANGKDYTFYTLLGDGKKAYTGSLNIDGNVWTYGPAEDAKDQYPLFRTTNTFNNGTEVSVTEFTEDGKTWTKMLEGELKRSR